MVQGKQPKDTTLEIKKLQKSITSKKYLQDHNQSDLIDSLYKANFMEMDLDGPLTKEKQEDLVSQLDKNQGSVFPC